MNAFIGSRKSIRRVSRTIHVCELFENSTASPQRVEESSNHRHGFDKKTADGVVGLRLQEILEHAHHNDGGREAEPEQARLCAFDVAHLVAEDRERTSRAAMDRKTNHDAERLAHDVSMGSRWLRDKLETHLRPNKEPTGGNQPLKCGF